MNLKFESLYFQNQGIEKLNIYIKQLNPSKIIFLTDENTQKYCYPKFILNLNFRIPINIITIKSGEIYKTIETCNYIWLKLLEFQIDRKALMINLGGGVITDLGGFVASTYMRGINFINIPTTLLSMVDASVGGKTGIDVSCFKNLVGTFKCAVVVLIHSQFLHTLNELQLKSGFAEIIKHALIADKNQWNKLKKIHYTDINKLEIILPKSIALKFNIVKLDFREKNIRKILNFGHTIGHALESYFLSINNPILHGEAIAMGMLAESFISYQRNILSECDFLDIKKLLLKIYRIYDFFDVDFKLLMSIMKQDKKNKFDKFQFSLINSIGHGVYNQEVNDSQIIESFHYLINLKHTN